MKAGAVRAIAACGLALWLQGCGNGPLPVPAVDGTRGNGTGMDSLGVDGTGVDEARLTQDLFACYDALPELYLGNPVARCLERKGYRVRR